MTAQTKKDQTSEIVKREIKALIEALKEGVIIVDTDQKVVLINKSAADLTGFGQAEVVNQPLKKILNLFDEENNEIHPDIYCPRGQIELEGIIYKESGLNLIDKKDYVRLVDVESKKVKGSSSLDLGCIITLDNISQKNELERMKIDFISMAVHVLRTPVTVLKGYLSDLLNHETLSKLEDKELESLNAAAAGVDNLKILIENLLHLSDIQSGKFNIYPLPVNLEGIVTATVADFKRLAEAKGLEIIYNPPLFEFPMVRADVNAIKEVLINLLDNAVKFTEKGVIRVSIGIEKGFVKVSVSDTGRGIPKDNLHYLFTKFYRIKDPLEMESGGGMGLYISKKIIDAHNGEIWVESVEGRGSTFYFTLPLK